MNSGLSNGPVVGGHVLHYAGGFQLLWRKLSFPVYCSPSSMVLWWLYRLCSAAVPFKPKLLLFSSLCSFTDMSRESSVTMWSVKHSLWMDRNKWMKHRCLNCNIRNVQCGNLCCQKNQTKQIKTWRLPKGDVPNTEFFKQIGGWVCFIHINSISTKWTMKHYCIMYNRAGSFSLFACILYCAAVLEDNVGPGVQKLKLKWRWIYTIPLLDL